MQLRQDGGQPAAPKVKKPTRLDNPGEGIKAFLKARRREEFGGPNPTGQSEKPRDFTEEKKGRCEEDAPREVAGSPPLRVRLSSISRSGGATEIYRKNCARAG
jgi:hypothetical protein